MEELKIVVKQERGTIATNFDAIEESLNNQMEIYKGLEVSEENRQNVRKIFQPLEKWLRR